jgi:mannose-1-phosphate guanylyltransferase
LKGIVFCGGRGVRLRPLTYYLQKVMVPIGSKQKPILEFVIRLLRHHGINDIVLMVNYKANQIINYFNDGSRFKVNITFIHDKPGIGGTGGALLNAFRSGAISEDDTLLVYYGDIVSNINLSELLSLHAETGAAASVALSMNFPLRVGVAEVMEDGRISRFVEKPRLEKPVSIGILALEGRTALKYLKELIESRKKLDIMSDLIPHLIVTGEQIHAYITKAFWYDIGTAERYEKLENAFLDEKLGFLVE